MRMRFWTRRWIHFEAFLGKLPTFRRSLSRGFSRRRPRPSPKKPGYRLVLEQLEEIAAPGSTASFLSTAYVAVMGYELLNLSPEPSERWMNELAPNASLLPTPPDGMESPSDAALEDYWQQVAANASNGAVNDVEVPDHAEMATAGTSAGDTVWATLGGVILSNTIPQASADPLGLSSSTTSGNAGGGGGLTDAGSGGGAAGGAGAATGGGAASGTTSGGSTSAAASAVSSNVTAGSPLFIVASTGPATTAQPTMTTPLAPSFTSPAPAPSQVNLQAWSQSQHGQTLSHQGLAGSSSLNPSSLNRHTGAGTQVTRHTGAPIASLSHGGQAGLGFGIAAPPPGQAGLALSAIADQAAAHAADTRGSLQSATDHATQTAQRTDNPAGRLAASTTSALSVLPALRGTPAATGDTSPTTTAPAHTSLLAAHLAATPVHVHDPETFTDSDNGSSNFTLTGQGSDSTGSFTLTEAGSVSSTWSENGDDESDNWTFSETGSFTVTQHYSNGTTHTSTVPINVQESSSAGDSDPTGFDLDGYNQSQIYGAGSLATYTITATGSETYSASDTGTITDDEGDDFTFTVGDQGGDGFSEDDTGEDDPNASGSDDTSGSSDDSDNGNETDTTTITGTLAGGGTMNYSDTDTSGYTDSDEGDDSETGGADSIDDSFDDTVSASDSPSLTMTEPVSDNDSGFAGTLTYTDTASDSYDDSDQGDVDASDSGTDNFDDSDSGSDDCTMAVTGSVNDPTSGFTGTVSYSDHETGSYHDHDHGPETDTDGAESDTDNFDDGASGSETIIQSASGSINAPDGSFTGTMSFSDTDTGNYSDDDTGAMTDGSDGSETGTDNFDDTDSGSDSFRDTVQGAISNPSSGFSGTASYSDTGGGSYHDSDQGPDTESAAGDSDTDNFDDGDNGNETVTESVSGSVNAPDGSFVGTVSNRETTTGTYHDEDDGAATDAADGTETGTDNFDDGDGGSDTQTVSINGTLSGTATVRMSDTVGDSYDDDDDGSDTEATTGETEQDTYTGDDDGEDDFLYYAAGTLPGTNTAFSDSDTSDDEYDWEDTDTGSTTAQTENSTVTTDDDVNDQWTQHTGYTNSSNALIEADTTTSTDTQNDHAVNSSASANGTVTSSSTAGTRDNDGANWRDVDTNYNNGAVTRVRTSTSNWQDNKVVSAAGTAETFSDTDIATYVVHGQLSVAFVSTSNWQIAANGTLVSDVSDSVEIDYGIDGSFSTYDFQVVWDGSEYVETETDTATDENGNTRLIEPPQVTDAQGPPPSNVGEPGFWESMIPIWGSGRSAIANFQQGNYGWAAFNAAMAVSDVFLVKSLVTAAGKGLVKVGGKALSRRGTGAFLEGASAGGQGLGRLAGRQVAVTERGLQTVKNHLAQFGEFAPNKAMIERLETAMQQGKRIAGADASFYMHEVNEATMMGRGLSYEAAHQAALNRYAVSPYSVYAPEVIQALPHEFNSNWFTFWGL